MNLFNNIRILCDAPQPWGVYFQDSASPQMEALVELHDNIMFYLVIILFGVAWIMVSIIRNYVINRSPISNKYFNHGTLMGLCLEISPALILILIAFPSFKFLYFIDEVTDPSLTVFVEGHQWYLSYQYPYFTNDEELEFDLYLVPDSDLEAIKLRLLEPIKGISVPKVSGDYTLFMNAPGGNSNLPGNPGNVTWPPRIKNVPIGNIPEGIIFTDSFATPHDMAVRDSVIANGYNNTVSQQPYATKLSKKLDYIRKRDSNSGYPDTLSSRDCEYIRIMNSVRRPVHGKDMRPNTTLFARWLRQLP